ncbi:MAG: tRNA (adenosine(37)-N6)-dimethylallyltransferase MiaA [Candidatus Kapaibacteriales bacterium]
MKSKVLNSISKKVSLLSLNSSKKVIPVVCGPTASGKSDFAIELAKEIGYSIISADSRQVYRFLDIGTAKIPIDKNCYFSGILHSTIDFLSLDQTFSAGMFAKDVDDILEKDDKQIICGGTGFYIDAFFNKIDPIRKRSLQKNDIIDMSQKESFERLKDLSPIDADKIDKKNPVRVKRALEYVSETGKPFFSSKQRNDSYLPFYIMPNVVMEEPPKRQGPTLDSTPMRYKLYEQIDARCDLMWKTGLKQETHNSLEILEISIDKALSLLESGELPNSLNTVGYKEMILFLSEKYSKDQAIDLMKKNTRNYAKRQLTWFRRIATENEDNTCFVEFSSAF